MLHPDIRTQLGQDRMRAIEQEAQAAAQFTPRPSRTEHRSRLRLRPAFLKHRRSAAAETAQTPRVQAAR